MKHNRKILSETLFWKMFSSLIGAFLLVCIILNLQNPSTVPPQITSFLFGCLICIATGYSIVIPRSSPVLLAETKETKFRRQQYAVGIIMSILITLMFFSTELRAIPSIWILMPFIFLSPVLIIREMVVYKRKNRHSITRGSDK